MTSAPSTAPATVRKATTHPADAAFAIRAETARLQGLGFSQAQANQRAQATVFADHELSFDTAGAEAAADAMAANRALRSSASAQAAEMRRIVDGAAAKGHVVQVSEVASLVAAYMDPTVPGAQAIAAYKEAVAFAREYPDAAACVAGVVRARQAA